ncbi:Uncharacterised protein [Klebsiella pneumoniae]|nr:Uncharacterised protein [Klebsiella pneumoniae]
MVEARRAEHGLELVADVLFQLLEAHRVELAAAYASLGAGVHAGVRGGRHVDHVHADRLPRVAWMPVAAEVDREVQLDPRVGQGRRVDLVDAEGLPGLPVAQQYLGVHQRELDVLAQRVGLLLGEVAQQVRHHHVVAGHHAVLAAYPVQAAGAAVADIDAAGAVAHADGGAVQAQAHRVPGEVQLRVVEAGHDDVLHASARRHRGDQVAHHEPSQRGVAVGEMVDVRLVHFRLGLLAGLRQAEGVEAGEAGGVCVGRRQGVGAEGREVVAAALEVLHRGFREPDVLEQVVAVAGLRQVGFLLFHALAGKIVAR